MAVEMNKKPNWLRAGNERVLIAGPCSAESEIQVMSTAAEIKKSNPNAIFRAGVWKPRTRPGLFEGVGLPAFEWLKKVRNELGLRVATEVALPWHVEAALKNNIDFLWIGARTTVNPFMVQELAEVLKGVDIPVLVKNPVHPDLQLWLGGLERFKRAGISKLAAIHRGFYTFEHSELRNIPRWELVCELMSTVPEIPIICDISHIAGSTRFLQMIAQQAVDLDMDGLMIETHIHPAKALSDSQQQVTPDELAEILSRLSKRNPLFTEEVILSKMSHIRAKIDELDKFLLQTLSDRMDLAKDIAELKKEHQVSVLQLERWRVVIEGCMHKADEMGLYKEFIRNIFIQIHDESIRIQSAILSGKAEELS